MRKKNSNPLILLALVVYALKQSQHKESMAEIFV
jgi:hypothetical protein